MTTPHSHSKQIQGWSDEYLNDIEVKINQLLNSLKNKSNFSKIYQISLCLDVVLDELSTAQWTPSSKSLKSIVLRIPLLVATGQSSAAIIELRRLVELSFWVIYFQDHPIEWKHFIENSTDGYHSSIEQPISYSAHRNIKFYVDYADELLIPEPSGLAKTSINTLRKQISTLNSTVHPGQLAAIGSRVLPFEDITNESLDTFSELHKSVCSDLAIVLAAIYINQFNRFPPMCRGHFNWLLGKEKNKKILSGEFGLLQK